MLLVWTAILYSDDPTVLVLTDPEFLLVTATSRLQKPLAVITYYSLLECQKRTQHCMSVGIAHN